MNDEALANELSQEEIDLLALALFGPEDDEPTEEEE